VNGHQYNLAYYLTNCMYPPYATLIQSISEWQVEKKKPFAKILGFCNLNMQSFVFLVDCGNMRIQDIVSCDVPVQYDNWRQSWKWNWCWLHLPSVSASV
jgi:hypothetical protein